MAEEIKDGTGTGNLQKVDGNNQSHNYSVVITEQQDATSKGNSYNINTGIIGLTSSSESGVLYFKNDEPPANGESTFVIDAIAIGINNDGTNSEMAEITIIRNPDSVSFSTAVDISSNRNFGSSNTLSSDTLAYKGAEAATVTGGNDFAILYQSAGTRGFYPIDVEIPKGGTLAVTINPKVTSGTTTIYAAVIGHKKDGKNN